MIYKDEKIDYTEYLRARGVRLDKTFIADLKRANGDGEREARFCFLEKAFGAAKMLSTPNVREVFGEALKEYGRAAVGVCIAATIERRIDRLRDSVEAVKWSEEVLKVWSNKPASLERLNIDDGLHPTRIVEWAGDFIRLTSERG